MSVEPQPEAKKVGAVIYLSTNRPLHLPEFFAEFRRSWPSLLLQKTGTEPHCALFRVGKSNFALELHHTPVPPDVSEPVVHSTLHWPVASDALAHHQAYLSVMESGENSGVLNLALWIGVRWDAQASALHTHGMAQFDAPEICLAQQSEPTPRMAEYLFHVGQSLLTSHHPIVDGGTTDSPHGKLKIEKSGGPGKGILILKPAR